MLCWFWSLFTGQTGNAAIHFDRFSNIQNVFYSKENLLNPLCPVALLSWKDFSPNWFCFSNMFLISSSHCREHKRASCRAAFLFRLLRRRGAKPSPAAGSDTVSMTSSLLSLQMAVHAKRSAHFNFNGTIEARWKVLPPLWPRWRFDYSLKYARSLSSAHSNPLIFRCAFHSRGLPDSQHMDGFESQEFIKHVLHLRKEKVFFIT